MKGYNTKDSRSSLLQIQLNMRLNEDELNLYQTQELKCRLDFGLQARLQGKPFLVVLVNNIIMCIEEDVDIFSVVDRLLKYRSLRVVGYSEDVDYYEDIVFYLDIEEKHVRILEGILSEARFRNSYGFWSCEAW